MDSPLLNVILLSSRLVLKIFEYALPVFIVLQGGYLSVNVENICIWAELNCLSFRDIMSRVSSLTYEAIIFDQVQKTVLVYIREHRVTKRFLLEAHGQKGQKREKEKNCGFVGRKEQRIFFRNLFSSIIHFRRIRLYIKQINQ